MTPYPLSAKFATEVLSSALAMYIALGVIANNIFSRDRGGAFGFGFVAFGFGLAFAVPLVMFDFVSAHMNPAMTTALWITGVIGWREFLVASAGEYVGMFVGAFLMWVHYWPQFDLVPGDVETPATRTDLEADARKKLACFACPGTAVEGCVFHAFFAEFTCTTIFISSALLMYSRHSQIADVEAKIVYRSTEGMWIGFMIFVMVLALAGVTPVSANPSRDLSPRLLHSILPIKNKGPSNWKFAIVPFLGSNLGGVAAGFAARGLFALTGFSL